MQLQLKHNKKTNPIHINKCALSWLSKQQGNITLSPKADGIYAELKYNKHIFQAEYIKEINLYLIFDTLTYPFKHSNTLINRYKWIQTLHVMKKEFKNELITSQEEFNIYTNYDSKLLEKYITNTTDNIKWFPKIMFQINMRSDDFLSLLDTNNNKLLYKTDGFIITSLKHIGRLSKFVYKYKPKNELTIDILYKEGSWYMSDKQDLCIINNVLDTQLLESDNQYIFRCYWDDKTQLWIPREIRLDKTKPNNINIVNELESLHKDYWKASDLITYYYDDTINKLDTNYIYYLQNQRANYKTIILDTISKFDNILDIGCGKGYLLQILKGKNITLVDINPSNIFILQNKYEGLYTYICSDMNTYSKYMIGKYDIIIFNNSLHYMRDINEFLENINCIYIYIHFIDSDLIFEKFDYNDIKIIKMEGSLYEFNYPWKKNKFYENLLSFTKLNKKMEKHNWKITNIFEYENDEFTKIHKYILYTKTL